MYCEVFRYRSQGIELPSKEAVKATRVCGDLVYRERIYDPRPGRSLMLAMLLADDRERYVIPALDRAHVTEVDAGLFIDGIEAPPAAGGAKTSSQTTILGAGSVALSRALWRPILQPRDSKRADMPRASEPWSGDVRRDEVDSMRLKLTNCPRHSASTRDARQSDASLDALCGDVMAGYSRPAADVGLSAASVCFTTA